MQLTFTEKMRVGIYVTKQMITKPTYRDYNPNKINDLYTNPEDFHQQLLDKKPAFFCPQIAAWVISLNHQETFELSKDKRLSFSTNDWRFAPNPKPLSKQTDLDRLLSGLLMALPDDQHMRVRRIVQKAFLPRKIAKMEPLITRHVDALFSKLTGIVNFADLAGQVPLTVISEILSIPASEYSKFEGLSNAILASYMPRDNVNIDLANAGLQLLRELIEKRREKPEEDFVSDLVQAADDDGEQLSIHEVMAFIGSLVVAAPDTTRDYINAAIYEIWQRPQVLSRLQTDPQLIVPAINESQRMRYMAHSGMVRFAKEDITIAGQHIEKGEMIKFNVNTANVDAAVFPDPKSFDIDRSNLNKTWTFGNGPHFCVGKGLADLISRIYIERLLTCFPHATIHSEPTFTTHFVNRQMSELYINLNNETQ